MLEKLDQNDQRNMTETKENQKHHLSIHHTNLFRPRPMPITKFALYNSQKSSLAVIKQLKDDSQETEKGKAINLIEIYKVTSVETPKHIITVIDYETITGIDWINAHNFITVTKEQTINLYNSKRGVKVYSLITDYGPITSMKLDLTHDILLTGTELGYVVVYSFSKKLVEENFTLTLQSKMVKVNGKINAIDISIQPKLRNVTESVRKTKNSRKKPSAVIPGKRKRVSSGSSDTSSSSESEDETKDVSLLGDHDATIFGASQNEVIVWDYHKKSIIETIKVGEENACVVNALITLRDGDLVTGDSTGTISFFDHKTLTCKHSTNILEGEILCLVKNDGEKRILVSGRDPSVVILKQNVSNKEEYLLFERVELHTKDVTSIVFVGKKNFLSGSLDGILGKYRIKGGGPVKVTMEKSILIHNYTNQIKFSNEQMMIQAAKTLIVWKLPKVGEAYESLSQEELGEFKPIKQLYLKTKEFIQTSAISDNLISYATKKGVQIFIKVGGKMISYDVDKKLSACNHLEFCFDNNYLIAGESDKVHLIDLKQMFKETTSGDYPKKDSRKCPVVVEMKLGSSIKQLCYAKPINTLFMCTAGPKAYIHVIKSNEVIENIFSQGNRYNLQSSDISFVTYNAANKDDDTLYVYTNDDRIIRLKSEIYNQKAQQGEEFKDIKKVGGLPEGVNILGMFILTNDHCVLYDSRSMFKVDMNTNRVVAHNTEYNYIIKVDNSVFDCGTEAALVELSPEDYNRALPSVVGQKLKRKFGA